MLFDIRSSFDEFEPVARSQISVSHVSLNVGTGIRPKDHAAITVLARIDAIDFDIELYPDGIHILDENGIFGPEGERYSAFVFPKNFTVYFDRNDKILAVHHVEVPLTAHRLGALCLKPVGFDYGQ